MNILILFEESGTIRDYAIDQGHFAISIDLLPGRGRCIDFHVRGDVYEILKHFGPLSQGDTGRFSDVWENFDFWDLVIMHPECTAVTVAGNRWYAGTPERKDAISQIEKLWAYPFNQVCLENPVGVISTQSNLGKPTQYIQPYQFGHMEQKKTGLWLRNLPPLIETDNVYDEMMKLPLKERTKVHYASPGPNRSRDRSKTYTGIAKAMVDQWAINYSRMARTNHNQSVE